MPLLTILITLKEGSFQSVSAITDDIFTVKTKASWMGARLTDSQPGSIEN